MVQELIYTSAESGLKAGSRGFCTVAATDGMPPRIVTLLESLSGYRHTHPPTQQPHPSNPVNWSHLHTEAGDSLLSRIADAGLDYSGRSNKIAHHVLLSGAERAVTGPAAMVAAAGNLVQNWDRPPVRLPTRSLAAGSLPNLPAAAWQNVSGDAGWAGVLAATATDPSQPAVYLVYNASQNVFSLIQEAMALLPPEVRWRVTFSTFFTGVPPGMSCQWRCVLAGSREHASVPPHNRVVRIDLTKPLGTAPDRVLVQRARTGVAATPPAAAQQHPAAHDTAPSAGSAPPVLPLESHDVWQQPPQLHTSLPQSSVFERVREHHSPKHVLRWIAAGIVVLAFLSTAGWLLYQAGRNSRIAEIPITIDPAEAIERKDFEEIEDTESSTKPTPGVPLLADIQSEQTDDELMPESVPEKQPDAKPAPVEMSGDAPIDKKNVNEIDSTDNKDPLASASQTPPKQESAESESAKPDSVELHYLLSPEVWSMLSNPKSGWADDRDRLVVTTDLPQPKNVIALELIGDNQMQKLADFEYQSASGVLQLRARDDALSSGVVRIATFAPNQIILAPNYAKRIGPRFCLTQIGDKYHLLTLYGAVTPQHGMDQPLTIRVDASKPVTRSLGAISPALLANAKLQLTSMVPNDWTLKSSAHQLLLVQPAKQAFENQAMGGVDAFKRAAVRKPKAEDNELEIRLDVQSFAPLFISYKTSEALPAASRWEFALTSEIKIASKSFSVTLSRFIIEIP